MMPCSSFSYSNTRGVTTTILDGPSVSIEGSTQQGVESVVEVTPASSVTSHGSSDPSLRLRLLRELRAMARTATGVVIVSVSVRVSSSSRDALWWCRGHLWLRCRGRQPLRLHLLLRQGGRVLLLLVLLLLLASVLLLLVQATMQSLQVTGLIWHRATQWTLCHARRQKGDHRLTCSAPDTGHLQKTS
jgi:hypothetical protein